MTDILILIIGIGLAFFTVAYGAIDIKKASKGLTKEGKDNG